MSIRAGWLRVMGSLHARVQLPGRIAVAATASHGTAVETTAPRRAVWPCRSVNRHCHRLVIGLLIPPLHCSFHPLAPQQRNAMRRSGSRAENWSGGAAVKENQSVQTNAVHGHDSSSRAGEADRNTVP